MSGESYLGSGLSSRSSSYKTTEYLANINKDDEPSNQEFDPQELFNQLTNRADVVLVAEGRDIHTQRILLTRASPVFERMLQSRNARIELLGKRYTKIQEMLTFLYPCKARITKFTDIGSLLDLSKEYQIDAIKSICEKYLLSKESTVDLLIVAQDYELQEVLKKCMEYLGSSSIVLEKHPRYHEITLENASTLKSRQLDHVYQLNGQLGWSVFALAALLGGILLAKFNS